MNRDDSIVAGPFYLGGHICVCGLATPLLQLFLYLAGGCRRTDLSLSLSAGSQVFGGSLGCALGAAIFFPSETCMRVMRGAGKLMCLVNIYTRLSNANSITATTYHQDHFKPLHPAFSILY